MPVIKAQGRLPGEPVAIVDIGSNSVRLVAYESHSRAPTPTFNEKALCGLGRGVATTGLLPEDAVAKALAALHRFRVLCDTMRITDLRSVATAAVRDAANGPQFLSLAERAIGCQIELLSGLQEARFSALGVASSIHNADGLVGDLGGGSLELTDVKGRDAGYGLTLPLGGLSLMDLSERSPKKATKIVRETLSNVKLLHRLPGRTFYAVGGTWRALARLHMRQRQYPMNVMHNYVIPSRDALEFAGLVERIDADALLSIESVSSARRPLLAYGAAVLEEIIRHLRARRSRGAALFATPAGDADGGPPDSFGAGIQSAAFAGAGTRGGAFRLDEPADGVHTSCGRRGRPASPPCGLPPLGHFLARPSRLSRRAGLRPCRQCRIHWGRSPLSRLLGACGGVPSSVERRLRYSSVTIARDCTSTRSRANSRRRDAGRLQHFGGHAGRSAARADDLRQGPGRVDPPRRPRRA
jgi:exopolyphosphatase